MNCEEFEELSGAYAIGALTEEERVDAEAHLAGCDKHREVAALTAVANSLALASPSMEPPARLKSRLMEAIGAGAPEQARTQVERPRAPRRSVAEAIRGWFGNARLGFGMAAALSVVVAALLVWNVSLQGGRDSNALVVDMTGQVSGQLVYVKEKQIAVMDLHGLEDLPSDKVYEVWALSDGRATPLGIFLPTNGEVDASLRFDASQYDTIAVTVEDAPGVDQPTTDPITLGEL
jgi:anti-sigma-K factor RskA